MLVLGSCKYLSGSRQQLFKLTLCVSSEWLRLEPNSEIKRKSQIWVIAFFPSDDSCVKLGHWLPQDVLRPSHKLQKATFDSRGFKEGFTLWQSHQLFPTKAHLSPQPTSRNSLWLGSWNKAFCFHSHFALGDNWVPFFPAVIKTSLILYWFSALLFQYNIPICLGLISLSQQIPIS